MALVHAFKWRSCGAPLSAMAAIIKFIASHTEDGLLKEFKSGCNVALYIGLKPSRSGEGYEVEPMMWSFGSDKTVPKEVDLEHTYREVKKRIAKLQRRVSNESQNTGGRRRAGLSDVK